MSKDLLIKENRPLDFVANFSVGFSISELSKTQLSKEQERDQTVISLDEDFVSVLVVL